MAVKTGRIIGHMVTCDEEGRYLRESLETLTEICDEIAVYDDRSTDATAAIAAEYGWTKVRPSGVTGFAEHEGKFRQAAWEWMSDELDLTPADIVVSVDADEFLVGKIPTFQGVRSHLRAGLAAKSTKAFIVDEIFGIRRVVTPGSLVQPHLLRRVDGWWDRITAVRACRWTDATTFADRVDGCGSLPQGSETFGSPNVVIVHLGYLRAVDRGIKQTRYLGGTHNMDHVRSITASGRLVPWIGTPPAPLQRIIDNWEGE